MALRTTPRTIEQQNAFNARFSIAQDTTPDNLERRQELQRDFRELIQRAGVLLDSELEPSQELSVALTHLQTALLFGGKAIFA